ncbi:MAG TPA: ornithine--oxo-acid transaminase [Longimicrobiales bacterium]
MTTQDYLKEVDHYSANNYHPLPVVLTRGEGVYVWDVEERRYFDMLSGYSALNHGHSHPRLVRAVVEQAQRLTLTSRAFHNDRMGPFLHRLCDVTGFEAALPMNTGAEAVETAIKCARKWGYEKKGIPEGKAEIITFAGNFHGRTTTVISFSSEPLYQKGFGPFTPGFRTVPFGDTSAVRAAISPNTAAILVEPVQGEAGVVVPPEGFLRSLAALCSEHNILLIADEIQTGLGRTGRMFACEHENVRPDVMILGKALGGGFYPVSAIVADRKIMDVFTPGSHGSTFGGNPLGAAVGLEALNVLVEEKLPQHAAQVGDWFMNELRAIGSPAVELVRGKGLLIGVVIKEEFGLARPYCEALMERGILCKETHDQVVRFAPPLVATRDQLREVLPAIRDVLAVEAATAR